MSETTRRLKLRIPSGTSQDSRYNLQRIDDFAGAYNLSDTGDLIISVRGDLILSPNARAAGGSGSGGVLKFGTEQENVAITFFTSTLNFEKPLSLKNQLTGETNYLSVQYSSSDGDDRTLTLDVQSGNRTLTLGGNISTQDNLSIIGAYPLSITLSDTTSVVFPETGTLLTDDAVATLTNKTISGSSNTISNISLTSSVTGILPTSNGGTGASTAQGARTNLLPSQTGNSGKILQTNGTDVSWVSPSTGQVQSYEDTWSASSTKTVTHGIGTEAVNVVVRDENNDIIFVDVVVDSTTQISLTSSEVPAGTWNILVQGAP